MLVEANIEIIYTNILIMILFLFLKGIDMLVIKFIKGLFIGIAIAAPVGPVGLLCMQRTVTSGLLIGLASGLGAASADTLYGLIAALGLTFISTFLEYHQFWFRSIGGVLLIIMGVRTYKIRPSTSIQSINEIGLLKAYLSTMAVTLANPFTIFALMAILAGVGISSTRGDYLSAFTVVSGVFIGSTIWWTGLSYFLSKVRNFFKPYYLETINKISGAVIIVFGVIAFIGLIKL